MAEDLVARLRSVARIIRAQPVLGHWPHMRAGDDANDLEKAADALEALSAHPPLLVDGETGKVTPLFDAADMQIQIDRLRAALQEYGQHQRPACRELPATETKFCYCGLTAALAGAADELHPREGDNRAVSAERRRSAAAVSGTPESYSRSDPRQDARTPAGDGVASPVLHADETTAGHRLGIANEAWAENCSHPTSRQLTDNSGRWCTRCGISLRTGEAE